MTRRNPFEEIERMVEQMGEGVEASAGVRSVPVDVRRTDDAVVVVADLPGYDEGDIDVRLHERRLELRAERSTESETSSERYVRRERRHEAVSRTVQVPADVVGEEASASYEHGVLTVTLPTPTAEDEDEGHHIDIG
jgi:HSP20 family protein